jgi:hypothetical protein
VRGPRFDGHGHAEAYKGQTLEEDFEGGGSYISKDRNVDEAFQVFAKRWLKNYTCSSCGVVHGCRAWSGLFSGVRPLLRPMAGKLATPDPKN